MQISEIEMDECLRAHAKDDLRHVLRQDPVARESIPYMVVLPEEQLTAFVYTWVNADSKGGAACCVYGPGIGPEPILEKIDGLDIPRDMDFTDWRVGDVVVRQSKPLEVVDVTYTGKRLSFEMHFEGMHPAYGYGGHPKGCPKAHADDRFEQSGLVTGAITVDGRRIPFNTTGHRDHSWGTREWNAIQHWKWFQGQSGTDVSVHFLDILVAGKSHLRGYIYKEGKLSEVTRIDFDFEHDAALNPLTMDMLVHDEAGRSIRVRGKKVASYPFLIGPQTINIQSGMDLEFDDKPGVGWLELSWPKAYVDYMASRPNP